ncbi:hypothetical protein [Alkalilimnicola ehrlichii]|uniref:hypothetical protein n=1 Tax=Alkalilimnicola ehrlichii TaxID=351052 RepID=UPI001C6F2C1E|nr:hypothetical protein [Alkalilimnicola ehrlichii]
MKVGKPLPPVPAVQSQDRRQAVRHESSAVQTKASDAPKSEVVRRWSQGNASYNIQLNRQLSSLQLADGYLAAVEARLSHLKFQVSRQISAADSGSNPAIQEALRQVRQLLEQRSELTNGALDPSFKLSLNEPPRVRVTLQGLDSIESIQQSGQETLVFHGGRQLSEPLVVLLEDNMSEAQVLRRFNASLGRAGIRAELDVDGQLIFRRENPTGRSLTGNSRCAAKASCSRKTSTRPCKANPSACCRYPRIRHWTPLGSCARRSTR